MSAAILAVDLGSRRIGLAVAESAELPAMPLATIEHVSGMRDAERIVDVARERAASTIVVGYPLRLDGTPGPAARNVERFVERLRSVFGGHVATIDERMTTGAAMKKLHAADRSGKRARPLIDRMAAVEILTSYLSQIRRNTT